MAITPIMAKTAPGPTDCLAGSAVTQAALESTSKWYEHSSGSVPTKVAVAWVARGSLSQWKEISVDFLRSEEDLLSSSSEVERFDFGPQGDPFVYCRTSLLPRTVKFDDCCLRDVRSSSLVVQNFAYPIEYFLLSSS